VPGREGLDPRRELELARRVARVGVREADAAVLARAQADRHRALDRHRQDRQAVVVSVLADQVDAAGRADEVRRRPALEVQLGC
jgi:hypothetical protein